VKCLFVINGLGLGNSTRCHAVIERLAAERCEVHVLTSGNGLAYFGAREEIASVTSMPSFFYSGTGTGISGWSTLKTAGALATLAKKKRLRLERLVDEIRPDIAVVDSEYCLAPLRRRRIPVVGLNTSEIVVSQYKRHWREGRGTRSHFCFVEYMDFLFHRFRCDLVLSPFPLRTPTPHARFRRIGLVVRPAILALAGAADGKPELSPQQVKRVVFMLSGSVHASHIPFERHELPFDVDVVGRPGESHSRLTFHGRCLNNVALLAKADALVINGGYSALSEAFALRKPTFVIPVPGHAEQFVNACLARDLGLGFIATEADVMDQLLEMHRLNRWAGRKPMPPAFEIQGAEEAAQAIAAFCAGRVAAESAPAGALTPEQAQA
jgi:UDP:flavonoid glycosyltransferase YjiC (YdhE family)